MASLVHCGRRLGTRLLGVVVLLGTACAHSQHSEPAHAEPSAPKEAAPAAADSALAVKSSPVVPLSSPYFTVVEFSFTNATNEWQHVRRVELAADRRMQGPSFEVIVGDKLRTWQLAARDSLAGKPELSHIALAELTPKKADEAPLVLAPPEHLLSLPLSVAPGLVRRKWAVLYTPRAQGLRGEDLVLEYELEGGKVERLLVQHSPAKVEK